MKDTQQTTLFLDDVELTYQQELFRLERMKGNSNNINQLVRLHGLGFFQRLEEAVLQECRSHVVMSNHDILDRPQTFINTHGLYSYKRISVIRGGIMDQYLTLNK